MSRIAAVLLVILGVAAGAIVGHTNLTGGIANLFASRDVATQTTPGDDADAGGAVASEPGPGKPAETVKDLPSCMRSRGVDTDAVKRQGPRAPDHKTNAAITICYIALNRDRMCEPGARVSVIESVQLYYDQRSLYQDDLGRRATMDADAIAHAPPQAREKIAQAAAEAQPGPMDQEIDAAVIGMFQAGYFSLDDLKHFRAKEEIGKLVGGLSSSPRPCS